MKIGQRVYVREYRKFGKVIEVFSGNPVKVKLDNGQIISVIQLTVQIISKLRILIDAIKNLFSR